jgi:hypothetical protein
MHRLLLASTLLAAIPAQAATVTVDNVGSILNQSEALPAESTPGQGIAFAQFFEFSLPTRETITVSMSDSGVGALAVIGGLLSLNTHVSTGPGPLFIPAGALIESSPIVNVVGGQEATVTPDVLAAGDYFAEVNGISGASRIKLAIDGTVTGITVPEPSTWVMLGLGLALLAGVGWRRKDTHALV